MYVWVPEVGNTADTPNPHWPMANGLLPNVFKKEHLALLDNSNNDSNREGSTTN